MAEKKKESQGLSRREFVVKAGAAVATGVVGSVMAKGLAPAEATEGLAQSGCIEWNADRCVSCSRCLEVCAVYHEGAMAPQLSRIKWEENDFLSGFRFRKPLLCKQCDQPECYYACPKKDKALCIDSETGARYINRAECIGCGACMKACPFEVSRVNFDEAMGKAIKCDLCKDRKDGPVCVWQCLTHALTFVPRERRAG
ncbi:MAG: 4Fe-4S dicluster domain-containing protein [candidate division NC10 bacterium]|nr:4Fe-4S dicluster domain-containing protein [candidate division NC10 bacterium]